ncbi:MAG: hypothetical protein V1645_03705 [archaeon]
MKTYFISYAIYTEDKQWAFGNTMKSFEGKITGDDLLSIQREIGKGWEKNIVKVLYFCEM